MKYLCSFSSQSDAEDLASQLERKGIAIVRTNVRTYQMIRAGKMKIDLWVGLEAQLPDAIALMDNPHHQVSNPVDVAYFHKELEQFKSQPLLPSGTGTKILTLLFGSVLATFVGWVLWVIVST
jgi:hypothetical protein